MTSLTSLIYKNLILSSLCLLLFQVAIFAQPIQLIPKSEFTNETISLNTDEQAANPFWEGTPPSTYTSYIDKLPTRLASSVLQKMRAKVLNEKYPHSTNVFEDQNLIFSLFVETGDFKNAENLLARENLEEQDDLWIRLKWAMGDHKAACHKIANLLRQTSQDKWKAQNVYCLYLNGENERAKVADELLREASIETHPLIDKLFNPSEKVTFNKEIANSFFLLNVWCSLGLDLSENELNQLSPSQLILIAHSKGTPQETRAKATLQAIEFSSFTPSLSRDAPENTIFHKLKVALTHPQQQALIPLFNEIGHRNLIEILARVYLAEIEQINPSKETFFLAPYFIPTFLLAQNYDQAQKWYTLFKKEKPDDAIALAALMHIAHPENPVSEETMQGWQRYQTKLKPGTAPKNSYILRSLLEALGEKTGRAIEGEPAAPSWRQEKALLGELNPNLLNAAASSNRIGEVYLIILASIGNEALRDSPVEKISHIVRALHKVSKDKEAKALAIEYLISKGL